MNDQELISEIIKLTIEYPNDMDLGKNIRELIININNKENE